MVIFGYKSDCFHICPLNHKKNIKKIISHLQRFNTVNVLNCQTVFSFSANLSPTPTISAPPMIFPVVTGIRLFTIMLPQFTAPASSPYSTDVNIAAGIKYILATQCSYPLTTNNAMGGKITNIFPAALFAETAIRTVRHTMTLQRMPRRSPSANVRDTFACATLITYSAKALSYRE